MKFLRTYGFSFFVLLTVALLISGCTAAPTDTTETEEEPDTTVVDNDEEDTTDTDEDVEEEPVDEETDEDSTIDEAAEEETDTDSDTTDTDEEETETSNDGGEKATIAGKFCYPTSPIPSDLRVYVKNKKTGYYWYITRKSQTTWTMSDLDPATYVVYLAGPEGSTLEEGRYTNSDNTFKEITVAAGDTVSGVEPCDFDF